VFTESLLAIGIHVTICMYIGLYIGSMTISRHTVLIHVCALNKQIHHKFYEYIKIVSESKQFSASFVLHPFSTVKKPRLKFFISSVCIVPPIISVQPADFVPIGNNRALYFTHNLFVLTGPLLTQCEKEIIIERFSGMFCGSHNGANSKQRGAS
jgi:hypothetical protein